MNASEAVIQALLGRKEARQQRTLEFDAGEHAGPYNVDVTTDGVNVQVLAADSGRYGLRLWRIRVSANGAAVDALARHDELVLGLSTRVSTPYGPFFSTEDNRESVKATLRTHRVGPAKSYYEAEVAGGTDVVVTHYCLPVGSTQREEKPVDLGMDMFRVMLTDLLEVARRSGEAPAPR